MPKEKSPSPEPAAKIDTSGADPDFGNLFGSGSGGVSTLGAETIDKEPSKLKHKMPSKEEIYPVTDDEYVSLLGYKYCI